MTNNLLRNEILIKEHKSGKQNVTRKILASIETCAHRGKETCRILSFPLLYRELLRAVTTACILEGKEGLKLLYSPTLLLFRENPSTTSTIKIFY